MGGNRGFFFGMPNGNYREFSGINLRAEPLCPNSERQKRLWYASPHNEVQSMSDHQDLDQQSVAGLRDVARMLLDGIEEVDDREQKRRLARRAFAVLQG